MSSDVQSRLNEIKTRLATAKRVIPYEDRDRYEKKTQAWNVFYQHAPSDIEWLISQLEQEQKDDNKDE